MTFSAPSLVGHLCHTSTTAAATATTAAATASQQSGETPPVGLVCLLVILTHTHAHSRTLTYTHVHSRTHMHTFTHPPAPPPPPPPPKKKKKPKKKKQHQVSASSPMSSAPDAEVLCTAPELKPSRLLRQRRNLLDKVNLIAVQNKHVPRLHIGCNSSGPDTGL